MAKKRLTDVATIKELFRIIQSIPSKKAEPFKQWLAKVGSERIEETIDPELSINRAIESYRRKGGSVAGNARKEIESKTGRKVITSKTAAELGFVMTNLLDSADSYIENE